MSETVGEVLGRCLARAGVTQVFGRPVPGLASHEVRDPALARALADADGRLGPGVGCALDGSNVLHLSCRPGAAPEPMVLEDPSLIAEVVARGADWAQGTGGPQAASFVLDLDLDAPAPAGLDPVPPPPLPPGELADPAELAAPLMVLVGPGVVRRDRVEALRALAGAGHLGVVNTWGAKGVFAWDSPHHLGTVGLQARDFELAGFAGAGSILGIGVDEDESPWARFALAPVHQVAPQYLDELVQAWNRPPEPAIEVPPLMEQLSAVCMPSYRDDRFPLHPGRAIIEVKGALGAGDRVAADPGSDVGLWVARAFPTSELGSVVVPATRTEHFAATAALAAALRPTPTKVVGIAESAESPALELARSLGVEVTLVAWVDDGGDVARPEDLADAVRRGGVVRVAVDRERTADLVAVAGPVVAWT